METPTTYLSQSGLDWRLIHQGMPLCRDGSLEDAVKTAARYKLTLPDVAWNGLAGVFFPFSVESK